MATTKSKTVKLSAVEARAKVEQLQTELDNFDKTAYCLMCKKHKNRDLQFYTNTDPMYGEKTCTPICRECAQKIALRIGDDGVKHSPTKESVMLALKYLQKPFVNSLWESSTQEAIDATNGSVTNAWAAYIRKVNSPPYFGLTYFDSDFYKQPEKVESKEMTITQEELIESHAGIDTYDSFEKNKSDVIRLLSYDPFEKEDLEDQPFLYSQLLGILDSSENANEDMMRTASAISIVRGFLQQSKIDDTIAKLMFDVKDIKSNSATIKSLQDSKSKITSVITSLAQDSCISLKHNKNAKKGENTWTGKIKKIKDLNLREGEVNGFDIETCKAMRQVMDQSNRSIMKMLNMDESEWSDIVADQRKTIVELQDELSKYEEISRILLRENLDIKDSLKAKNINLGMNLVNLNDLYSCFSDISDEASNNDEDAKL
ncbi:MAG: hypothetical protein ACLTWK_11995 [Eisenbergiella sp.]